MTLALLRTAAVGLVTALALGYALPARAAGDAADRTAPAAVGLEWNQIFLDALVATAPPNASHPRLGAILYTAVFDAYNGVDGRHTPLFMDGGPGSGASAPAAVVAAAHTALVGLFPSQQPALDARYAASLAVLQDECARGRQPNGRLRVCQERIERGVEWGSDVAHAVLAWRANDGFGASYPAFVGGTAVGQWRPTPPAFGPMSVQGLAFTDMFVLDSNTQFQPERPRTLASRTYADDVAAVRTLGRRTGASRTDDQTALARFWEGSATVHWNQAATQAAQASGLSLDQTIRLYAALNIAMADTASTVWSAKRFYASVATEVTWRPVTAIALADGDGNPDTVAEPGWEPLMTTPSHPEYPAGHPSLNGAGATALLAYVGDAHTFTLTTTGQPPRTYTSISQAHDDGNKARVWGGMHYPSTVAISDATGAAIARYVLRHAMQRRHSRLE
jgi:hypothetical protein